MAMAVAKKSWPLSKVTDGAHWDAEDLFDRLCMVADAAFLSAGFLPCDCDAPDPGTTTPCCWSLSRRYSVPLLGAHREGADAAVAVLCISQWGRRRGGCGHGGGKIEVDAYIDCNGRPRSARRERLPLAALAPVLSGGVDDVARALTTPDDDDANGGGAWWLWKLFADELCRRLFLSICQLHGDVPVLPSFACLPVDLQLTILCRLHVADDVARVACATKELRRLVADHDAVLWKAKYESMRSEQPIEFRPPPIFFFGYELRQPPLLTNKEPFCTDEDMSLMSSWKERYAMTRRQVMVMTTWRTLGTTPMPTWKPRVPSAKRARLETIIDMVGRRCAQRNSPQHHDEPRTVARRTSGDHGARRGTTVDNRSSRRAMMATTVVQSKPYRKGSGAGVVHSPSSWRRRNHR